MKTSEQIQKRLQDLDKNISELDEMIDREKNKEGDQVKHPGTLEFLKKRKAELEAQISALSWVLEK